MIDIFSLEKYLDWFVRVESPNGEIDEGAFVGYDGPSFDPDEEGEDVIMLNMKAPDGDFYLLSFESADIAEFTPIRKATKEELGMWGR
ncbi:hypothetical protein [Helicobacter bizzozeronii]|uniref:hypothetical protein n=1 Tax=Helicobacter bizzozeronii TaxID=56877 RepID=UPI00024E5C4A|nr:hypothetical protein [Helicobacter bizzozeronii]CCF79894.1 hypothetical protein HBZS_103420 [Helicobacter bizzozeronii CCUG 35545]